jgi:DNA-binding NarL/FixJ family response regulator
MPEQYVITRTDQATDSAALLDGLTPRESAILSLVSGGASNVVAAHHLGISDRTVNKHLEHIYAKLQVTNRTAAAAVWHRRLSR